MSRVRGGTKHEPCQVNTVAETPTIVCLDRQMGHITPQVVQEVRKGCMTSVRLESTPFGYAVVDKS